MGASEFQYYMTVLIVCSYVLCHIHTMFQKVACQAPVPPRHLAVYPSALLNDAVIFYRNLHMLNPIRESFCLKCLPRALTPSV